FLRRRCHLPCIDRCEIDDTRVIAQLHEELPVLRMRHRQCVPRETVRNLYGMSEVRLSGDRVDQVETAARELACQLRRRRTHELAQLRQTDQGRERLPVAGHAAVHHAKLQRTECRGAERPGRIEGHDRNGAVLERDAAICEAERRGVRAVGSAYLYHLFAIKRGGRLCTQGERQARTLWQLVIARELNVATGVRGRGLHALADEGDAWPRCGNDAFQIEHPPVL